jgi:hypothetical protein
MDSDLAALYGVRTKRLNEQVKRNAGRFGENYVFQLTKEEFDVLRSQSATSKKGRGGRRYLPWVFTEHGVVMAATVLDSEGAIEVSKFVVDVFIEVKRGLHRQGETALVGVKGEAIPVRVREPSSLEGLSAFWAGIGPRLQAALNQMLDTVVDKRQGSTVREEANDLIQESIKHLKDRLKKQGRENEEIAARVTKLLAEAEKEKSIAAKTRAEADSLEFATIVRKLRLLLEAQRAMVNGHLNGFLDVLKDMGTIGDGHH